MTLRVLAILVALLPMCLAGCATPPPTPALTVVTARPTLDDPILREVFGSLDALPVRADVLELHAALALLLAERGDAAQSARVITQARGRLERAEISDPAPLHAILDRAARDAHRAALMHGLSRAACGPWAASAPCRAALNATHAAAALARLIPPAQTDQALLSERKRCMLHRDPLCAVDATLALRAHGARALALVALRRDYGAIHPALAADALRAAIAAAPTAQRAEARWALIDTLLFYGAYAEVAPLLDDARAGFAPGVKARWHMSKAATSLINARQLALAMPLLETLESAGYQDIELRLEAQTLLEPDRATLDALLALTHSAAQHRLLLRFAEEVARSDLGLAREALRAVRDPQDTLELYEARPRVNIAAIAQRAGQPYDDLLDPVFDAFPEDTSSGAVFYVQYAAATAKLRGGPQRLARARALLAALGHESSVSVGSYATLISAQEEIGADADARDTFKQFLRSVPSRAVSSQAHAARVYDAEEVGHALRALLDARLIHHIPALLALPLHPDGRARCISTLGGFFSPSEHSPQVIVALRAVVAGAPDEEARLNALAVLRPLLNDPALFGEVAQTPVLGALSPRARQMAELVARDLTARLGAEATISWVWRIEDLPTRQSILMDLMSHLTQTSRPVAPSTIMQLRDVVSRGAGSSSELRRRLAALQVKAGDCRAAYATLSAPRVALSAHDLDGILWPCARSGADHIVLGLARLIEDEPTRARVLLTLAALPRRWGVDEPR